MLVGLSTMRQLRSVSFGIFEEVPRLPAGLMQSWRGLTALEFDCPEICQDVVPMRRVRSAELRTWLDALPQLLQHAARGAVCSST